MKNLIIVLCVFLSLNVLSQKLQLTTIDTDVRVTWSTDSLYLKDTEGNFLQPPMFISSTECHPQDNGDVYFVFRGPDSLTVVWTPTLITYGDASKFITYKFINP